MTLKGYGSGASEIFLCVNVCRCKEEDISTNAGWNADYKCTPPMTLEPLGELTKLTPKLPLSNLNQLSKGIPEGLQRI